MTAVISSASAAWKSCEISAEHQAKQRCLTSSFLCSAVGDVFRIKEEMATLTGSHPPAHGGPCFAAGMMLAAGNTVSKDCAGPW